MKEWSSLCGVWDGRLVQCQVGFAHFLAPPTCSFGPRIFALMSTSAVFFETVPCKDIAVAMWCNL